MVPTLTEVVDGPMVGGRLCGRGGDISLTNLRVAIVVGDAQQPVVLAEAPADRSGTFELGGVSAAGHDWVHLAVIDDLDRLLIQWVAPASVLRVRFALDLSRLPIEVRSGRRRLGPLAGFRRVPELPEVVHESDGLAMCFDDPGR